MLQIYNCSTKAPNGDHGQDATNFEFNSKLVEDFDTESLSGSAVVNKKGELIGIYQRQLNCDGSVLFAVDLNTIKEYLKANGIKHSEESYADKLKKLLGF